MLDPRADITPLAELTPRETADLVARLEANISSVVLGKREAVQLCLAALLAGEHILLEDVPGVGKTLLGKAIARSISAAFSRIQFTPDLLPGDIVGSSVYRPGTGEFVFQPGPIFAQLVLADEINRAPPRTQSALLEAMSERQVTVDGCTHVLSQPFLVIATQNPFEYEGTFALPESQLDRFLLRISLGYPSRDDERRVLISHRDAEPLDALTSVVTCAEVRALQHAVRKVVIDPSLYDYILDLAEASRKSELLRMGLSTRGSIALAHAAQAAAVLRGRTYVVPDDIKWLALPVMAHRILLRGQAGGGERAAAENLVTRLLDQVPAPI